MQKKYIVTLLEEERQMLQAMLSRGIAAARKPWPTVFFATDRQRGRIATRDQGLAKPRDAAETKTNRRFTTADARIRPRRLFPSIG